MDFSTHKYPGAEAILKTGIRVPVYQYMTEDFIPDVGMDIQKVACYYAV